MARSVLVAVVVLVCLAGVFAERFAWKLPNKAPPKWRMISDVPDDNAPVTLAFAMKQRNLDLLEKTLLAVSDPKNPRYGQYLSLDDLTDLIGPSESTIERFQIWLVNNGLERGDVVINRDWVIVKATVAQTERLLQCTLRFYQHVEGRKILRASTDYSMPSDIAVMVDFVAGMHSFPFSKFQLYQDSSVQADNLVNPSTLQSLYSVDQPTGSVKGSSQAVVEFASYYSESDLQDFFTQFAPQLVNQQVEQIYMSPNLARPISIEANLDVQYIMSMGALVNTSDYIVPTTNPTIVDDFLNYTYFVGNQTQPPLVHSISFGEYGGHYPNATVQRLNAEFQKMGARGISILLASGDNGVGCNLNCTSEEFDFPSSPYITMVGATYLINGTENGATLSAGGFSQDYWTPSYQAQAVAAYLNSGVDLPPASFFNANGRAYPDVAAIGQNVAIVSRGKVIGVSGTSCAAPIFAGIVSLLNNQRIAAGKSSLGFLNPLLYSHPEMFQDILEGSNPYKCCQGFECTKGWDPVTGMGTPNYAKMLSVVSSLP